MKSIEDGNKRLMKKGFARWGKTGKRKMLICLKNCSDLWANGMRTMFRRWTQGVNWLKMKEHGDRVKAFFIIRQYMRKASMSSNGLVAECFFKLYQLSLRF
jgi:hypothetical protein